MKWYTSDLSDAQYKEIEPYLPKVKTTRPRTWTYHEILNGIMYTLVSGCQWRNLPKDLPPWKTVYHYFSVRKKKWVFDKILKELHKKVRVDVGKKRSGNALTDGFTGS